MLVILGAMPLGFASETSENVAVIVSTPADAIVTAPYAKAMGYMLVYTPTEKLSDSAKRELERNHITKVIIVGGPVAVSNNVENQLKLDLKLDTSRIWGETRIETSQRVFEVLIKEKPEMAKNIVIAEGFNEKISPVAVSFDAPILYYGLDKDDKVIDTLKSVQVEHAVILGSDIPSKITNAASAHAKNTIIATGKEDTIIKTALSYVHKINPDIENKKVAVTYAEKSNDPILDAIVSFVKGDVFGVVPISEKKKDALESLISKVSAFASGIVISSDTSDVSEIISDAAYKLGITSTTDTEPARRGTTTTTTVTQPAEEKPAIKVIANGKTIEFEGQGGNTLSINGTKIINLPVITANVNVVDKKDTSKSVEIYFKDNASVESIIEAMNNFNVIAYNGDNITITYNNSDMEGKNVSLSIITARKTFRNNINELLNGNATGLINSLNTGYISTATVSSGVATFNIVANDTNADHVVVITEGNGIASDVDNVKILAVGGFEVMKYTMTVEMNVTSTDFGNVVENCTLSLSSNPEHEVRYGLLIMDRGTKIRLEVNGTNPNDNSFNVSVVGDNGHAIIINDSDLISLSAEKIKDITNATLSTATAKYSPKMKDNIYKFPETMTLDSNLDISNAQVIAMAYDTVDKRIVAVEERPLIK